VLEIDPTDAPLVFVRNKDPPVRLPILLNPAPEIVIVPPARDPVNVTVPPTVTDPELNAWVRFKF
jgi:hypothetical protein